MVKQRTKPKAVRVLGEMAILQSFINCTKIVINYSIKYVMMSKYYYMFSCKCLFICIYRGFFFHYRSCKSHTDSVRGGLSLISMRSLSQSLTGRSQKKTTNIEKHTAEDLG